MSEGLAHQVYGGSNGQSIGHERRQSLVDIEQPLVPFMNADREVELERTKSVKLETVDLGKRKKRDIGPIGDSQMNQISE